MILDIALQLAATLSFSGTAHVADGDTLMVGNHRIRLSGVDAPELKQRCGPPTNTTACGVTAANLLRQRVEGRTLNCTQVDRDRYERSVAVCRLNGTDINEALVLAGWATAYRQYSLAYDGAETKARTARRGIWASGFEAPADYRREHRNTAPLQPAPDPRCTIKGNINTKGDRIYHLPGSRDYPDVRIDLRHGERWFCSVSDASKAGWRPAR
ncbi:thermonuclease family protein [Sphingomonas sp. So64.6b]|uniref:thermonuclease family protein n=1 Tax=Sphingomonas sp. So64.6b TaxID=2997354 RepID=UPI001600F532|nr:thermonuclease family protein [Sphingomonas sp. So64.6b]QNA83797.1 thermonuclease family protein [Sphingomonas sp. So64.6b]